MTAKRMGHSHVLAESAGKTVDARDGTAPALP
jgi:hypothetical protein